MALVIDDLGRSLADLDTLADLGVPLSYAVLPFESMTPQVVAELRARGAEILCHLPMAPASDRNPGPGALGRDMPPRALARATRAALEAVPAAVGVSNHMGSELSSDAGAMRAILGVAAERGLFYLDSRTSAESAGYRTALELGIPAAERDVFLDADPRAAAIEREFQRLLALARERGAAIGIGHPHPSTLEALARLVPAARQRGYEFVPLSYLLDRPGELPE
ncbi:MAG TPA: divergent polysaccharide deacetylase family protein [Thermoanaerobaculia bacterium]|nr:divergent polysaccharide deacetylase family protein [Thermoanaerobaculia bacterium]